MKGNKYNAITHNLDKENQSNDGCLIFMKILEKLVVFWETKKGYKKTVTYPPYT